MNILTTNLGGSFAPFWNNILDEFNSSVAKSNRSIRVPLSLKEFDDRLEIFLDVPGVEKENLTVEFQEGKLSVSGDRNLVADADEKSRSYSELNMGRFSRVLEIPFEVDESKIEALHKNGVLKLKVFKKEKKKPSLIEVQSN